MTTNDTKTKDGDFCEIVQAYSIEGSASAGSDNTRKYLVINNDSRKVHSVWRSYTDAKRIAYDLNRQSSIELAKTK